MESLTKQHEDKQRREEEIRRQIAALQAQLPSSPTSRPPSPAKQPKRPRETTLAPATPSPKKKRKTDETRRESMSKPSTRKPIPKQPILVPLKPAPSQLLSKLAQHATTSPDDDQVIPVARSTALTDKPAEPSTSTAPQPTRGDDLTVIEDIQPGPYDHHPPFDDPHFDKLEPHSGIRLSSRTLPHEDLEEHMTGRYYISPSRLYSCIRLTSDKQGYDVPVVGDWLTIAVVAERGPVRYTQAPVPLESDVIKGKGKEKEKAPPKPSGKKYVIMKLVDFGARARSSSSATGGRAVVRGDACLSLFLFESDAHDTLTGEGSSKSKKLYKGGSGGAFESMSKLKEGDVIVLMNPRLMKPNQGSRNAQNQNVLGITPESAASISVIGRAADLGLCPAVKRDGSTCHSWFDKRIAQACDWHIQDAVKRTRSARAEFSIGTTGMSNTSTKKRNPAYDPAHRWGLKPEPESSSTYILNGHIARGGGSQTRDVAENMGREAQAKAQRKMAKDSDKMLKTLLDRDKDGMKAVMSAREFMSKQDDKQKKKKPDSTKAEPKTSVSKNSFGADTIKRIGFDPTSKPGQRREDADTKMQEKLDRLSVVQSSRRSISLSRRPRSKILEEKKKEQKEEDKDELESGENEDAAMIDLDD